MTKRPQIKVVPSPERDRRAELDANGVTEADATTESVRDSATIFGKWIREWRQEKRKGNHKRDPAS